MAALTLETISRHFGTTRAVDGVSLHVADGEFLTLLGASGCGKSTLLRIIAGLEPQDGGRVLIGGCDVDGFRPKQRDVAMVFQSYALYPYMTVGQNISLPLQMRQMNFWQRLPLAGSFMPGSRRARAAIAAEARATADALEIGALLHRKPAQLSGGQRQRVALARAMVRHPAAFLMDEPLSNLDARLRVQARAEIAQLHRRLGATFVYVTHDQAEAMTMSDRVAVMDAGRILQVAAPQALYDSPSTLDVARFIGQPRINLVPVRITAGRLRAGDVPLGIAADAPEGMATLAFRPEAVVPAGHGLPASVTHVEHLGPEVLVHLALAVADEPVVMRLAPAEARGMAPGTPLALRIAPQAALLFGPDGARLAARLAAGAQVDA